MGSSTGDDFSGCSLKPVAPASIHVVAGALFDETGRVLIAERPPGKHMAGHWEFPGGKLAAGEDRFAGLKRELKEELAVDVTSAEPLVSYDHEYADRSVRLDLWRVLHYTGTPLGQEGQRLQWIALPDLDRVGLLEADRPMIGALKKAVGCRP